MLFKCIRKKKKNKAVHRYEKHCETKSQKQCFRNREIIVAIAKGKSISERLSDSF